MISRVPPVRVVSKENRHISRRSGSKVAVMIATEQRQQLQRYLDELTQWNRNINLTRIDPGLWWSRHIDESLTLAAALDLPRAARLADVGSGCGVPGIPLAVLRPDIDIVLIESDSRKAGFLVHVAGKLGLLNVSVVPRRAEVVGHEPEHRETYDVVASRATASLPVLCELCLPLLRIGGRLAAMVTDSSTAILVGGASELCGGGSPHHLVGGIVVVNKLTATPNAYPRRPGVPARHPLDKL